ncbi:MAG: hypothetical protein J6R36_03475 [Bacteroidaceae bacterium]|nr:hypothetical protein [Bacteroidaceae bacterium]
MDKTFEYKGYVGEVYHFTRNGEITGYGAMLYKDGERLLVANHGWNLIQSYSIESVIEESKRYIDKL